MHSLCWSSRHSFAVGADLPHAYYRLIFPSRLRRRVLVMGVKTEATERKPIAPKPHVFRPFIKVKEEETSSLIPASFGPSYNHIVSMRLKIITPVDLVGCERIPLAVDPAMAGRMLRFQLLVLLMLSSQTKDEITFGAVKALHEHFLAAGYAGLCIDAIIDADEKEIDRLIGKVGFHNRKAGYLKKSAQMLQNNHEGDIPKLIEEIVALPGVGPKMGYLLLQVAWDIVLGIGVDVHLHRIANLLGWVRTKTPEQTRAALEGFVPRDYWREINPLVVGFGQTVCLPKAPNCDVCELKTTCKAVDRKVAFNEMSETRRKKLLSQRGDISALIDW